MKFSFSGRSQAQRITLGRRNAEEDRTSPNELVRCRLELTTADENSTAASTMKTQNLGGVMAGVFIESSEWKSVHHSRLRVEGFVCSVCALPPWLACWAEDFGTERPRTERLHYRQK